MLQAIENCNQILKEYAGMYVPDQLLVDVLGNDDELFMEADTGGIFDTCQRDMLINEVLRKIGLWSWPTWGDGEEVYVAFVDALRDRLKEIGGGFFGEES